MNYREQLKNKKRIVIKIGSSSLTYRETGLINISKLERLVRALADLSNQGKDVILVSSGAIAVGKNTAGIHERTLTLPQKQACAAIGQAQLMTMYQKLFAEYNKISAQVLITKFTMLGEKSLHNATNTFNELFLMGAIPVVNENDTVSTEEIEFGDNDTLSAIVASIIQADLLILLSDIDGLFSDDPHQNPEARFIDLVPEITPELLDMGKSTPGTCVGTGGMSTKLAAARIATASGTDMIIANGENVGVIGRIMNGENIGTLFISHKEGDFNVVDFLKK
ncbi:glutamate 5-kinase [Parasporobacterium paucivorans]|uniref:Glutamate 5-kinase n=1 Tax=Parasporobacterium paucivorans DSM 15970 TaxID=1122934 RepID=A0A1M6A1P9_9FIRM|nr:glutamate 5-kinase [Parasporobacterium paucivorans]SHI30390.1 glutamate 5-kinase [Parasporobacterium paucivorans DSM 15970]